MYDHKIYKLIIFIIFSKSHLNYGVTEVALN